MDTTTVTIEWALSELINKPQVLHKAQEEIELKIGNEERMVEDSDLKDLPYLHAIVKETLRLHPAGPLLVPHESTTDCVVAGFKISAGTRLLVNAWKIHRDPKWWDRPLDFVPERFIKGQGSYSDIDLRGQHFQLIPFGSGRRSCPGISLALSILHLSIARLLHAFKWEIPPSLSCLDMTEGPGLSSPKAIPLEALVVPKVAAKFYG
ncbi:hypothetical protein GIB67_019639 [Kingdonia uniflora]|uniref:Cytochrome P450 n=1 Tax=Kingdonia uniflora TaxID=39325 RepID=A0A7J7N0H8_9MAGN|nr:hypothetical protein GIB67_019639 [Kingdonia uniflora]